MEDKVKNSILVVDDEKSDLIYLNNLLSNNYSVFVAKEGGEAVRKAHELLPDLILLDTVMPGIDGYDTLAELKLSEMTQDIPVILITEPITEPMSEHGDDTGFSSDAVDFIAKPFNPSLVKMRVDNQIRIVNQMRTIESLSLIDQLTGIDNRRSFDQRLGSEWQRAVRGKMPISLLMIDVDLFRKYNEKYGHLQGDAALLTVAKVLTLTLKRSVDFAARWGGEEFAVVLPGTDIKGALVVAELISSNCRDTIIPCADGSPTRVTVSIGVSSVIPGQVGSASDFIAKADAALYKAKEMGRNRVSCY